MGPVIGLQSDWFDHVEFACEYWTGQMTDFEAKSESQLWSAAVRTQVRVVGALVRREMRAHFGETRLGYLWALFAPATQIAVLLFIFGYVFHRRAQLGTSITLFIATGVVPYFFYSKLVNYVSASIDSNRNLLSLPIVTPYDVIWARLILESATYFFVGFVMFILLYVGGISSAIPFDPLSVMVACVIAIFFGLGIGMVNIVIKSYFHNWMLFFHLLSFPMWLLSGIWYLPDQIPQPFRDYMLYNPVMHAVVMFRAGFYRDYNPEYLDGRYAVGVSAGVVALGMALMRVTQRRVLVPL